MEKKGCRSEHSMRLGGEKQSWNCFNKSWTATAETNVRESTKVEEFGHHGKGHSPTMQLLNTKTKQSKVHSDPKLH